MISLTRRISILTMLVGIACTQSPLPRLPLTADVPPRTLRRLSRPRGRRSTLGHSRAGALCPALHA